MILVLGDAQFDIDLEKTMDYYAREGEERCDCAYCRNFSAAVDRLYPNLRKFLSQFGIDIATPDSSMPYDYPNEMWYENVYCVAGNILKGEMYSFTVDGVEVYACKDVPHTNAACSDAHFFLCVGMIILPWVLEEPMHDVLSPANEPSFLRKMWDKLLSRIAKTDLTS